VERYLILFAVQIFRFNLERFDQSLDRRWYLIHFMML